MAEEHGARVPAPAPWPAALRLPLYAVLTAAVAVLLTGLGFWIERTEAGLEVASLVQVRAALEHEYLASGGGQRFAADLLCAWPWVLAAFVRAGRLATLRHWRQAFGRILLLSALVVFFNFFGQAVRHGGELTDESLRLVLASTVACVPPYLALLPVLVVASRLRAGAASALGLVLVVFVLARIAVPDLFSFRPIIDAASRRLLLFPPTFAQRVDLFTPMLVLWGVFTALEVRFEAREHRPGEPAPAPSAPE